MSIRRANRRASAPRRGRSSGPRTDYLWEGLTINNPQAVTVAGVLLVLVDNTHIMDHPCTHLRTRGWVTLINSVAAGSVIVHGKAAAYRLNDAGAVPDLDADDTDIDDIGFRGTLWQYQTMLPSIAVNDEYEGDAIKTIEVDIKAKRKLIDRKSEMGIQFQSNVDGRALIMCHLRTLVRLH